MNNIIIGLSAFYNLKDEPVSEILKFIHTIEESDDYLSPFYPEY